MNYALENLNLIELNTILQSLNNITIKGSDAPFLANLLLKVNNTINLASECEKSIPSSKTNTPKSKS